MRIFLDGATGYLGSAVARSLVDHGHEVVAHVRSTASAERVTGTGVTPVVGALDDPDWLGDQLRTVDGAIHTTSPSDAGSEALDTAVVTTVLSSFAGSGRPYVHTGGSAVHGSGRQITEVSPLAPPPIVAWRPAVDDRVRAAAGDGVRTSVVVPVNLYGHAGGLVALLIGGPVEDGSLLYPGGHQHFPHVHVDDAAELFVLALTDAPAGSSWLAAAAALPMDEVARAASRLRGLGGATRPEDEAATRSRLGPLADLLLIDATVDAGHAATLGWRPARPGLLDELTSGSYAEAADR